VVYDYTYSAKSFYCLIPLLEDSNIAYSNNKSIEFIVCPRTNDPWLVTIVSTSFKLVITPPHKAQSQYNIVLNSSCKGSANHTFIEPGIHRIEISLNNVPIFGSPRYIMVNPPLHSNIPIPRWRFLNNYNIDKHASSIIEALYQKGCTRTPEIELPSTGYSWVIDFTTEKASRKNWVGWTIEEDIFRDIWFWTNDNNQLVPYSPEHSQALENGFIRSNLDKVDVNDNEKSKTRWVKKEEEGEYRQYRLKYDAKPEGRKVYRGYYGQTIDLFPVPLLWQFKRVLMKAFLDWIPQQAILKIFQFSKQSELDQYALIVRDLCK